MISYWITYAGSIIFIIGAVFLVSYVLNNMWACKYFMGRRLRIDDFSKKEYVIMSCSFVLALAGIIVMILSA